MYSKILEMKNELDRRRPFGLETEKTIKLTEMEDFVFSNLRLDGSSITKEQVKEILSGKVVEAACISDHTCIGIFADVLCAMDDYLALDTDVDLRLIESIQDLLCDGAGKLWRTGDFEVCTYEYFTPPWQESKARIKDMVVEYFGTEMELKFKENRIYRAIWLHNRILKIYPFDRNNEMTARAVLYYVLKKMGFPIFEIRANEREYNNAVYDFLKNGNERKLYDIFQRSLYNKMCILLQLTEDT